MQHHDGDRDRRAEAGQRLEQRTEAERDDDRLHPLVGADLLERAAQHVEVARRDGEVVDPDRVDDDPQDREEAERRALGAGEQRLARRASRRGRPPPARATTSEMSPATQAFILSPPSSTKRASSGSAPHSALRASESPTGCRSCWNMHDRLPDVAPGHTPVGAPGSRLLTQRKSMSSMSVDEPSETTFSTSSASSVGVPSLCPSASGSPGRAPRRGSRWRCRAAACRPCPGRTPRRTRAPRPSWPPARRREDRDVGAGADQVADRVLVDDLPEPERLRLDLAEQLRLLEHLGRVVAAAPGCR